MSAQKSRPKGAIGAFLGLIGFSALAGLLVTVMVTPALAVSSMAATNTIDIFDNLPEYITIEQQPQQNQIFAKNGKENELIATVYSQNREELKWDEVPQVLKDATLAAEDVRFYEHGGIDLQGIARAAVTNITTGDLQGASTLTQQLVKNICIMKAVKDFSEVDQYDAQVVAIKDCQKSSFDRKLKEMKFAIGLEKEYSKDDVLLAYLNIAGFGGNTYGIQSAAQRYFGVDAKDVTIAQAASLLAIVQEPTARSLDNESKYEANQIRRDHILNVMGETVVDGKTMITKEQMDEALAIPVDAKFVKLTAPKNGCIAANSYAKQFCDYVVHSVKDLEALGSDAAERRANWKIGGYKLYTTLDLKLQKKAQDTVRKYAPSSETRLKLGSSAIGVGVGTGKILFMAQNKRFDDTKKGGGRRATAINFNTDFDYGGSSGFQVGSTYKVFTLLNWLDSGHGLNEVVNAQARTIQQSDFTDTCAGTHGGTWPLRNDSPTASAITVRQATAASVNGAFATMALQLDLCKTKEIAESLGIHTAVKVDNPNTTLIDNEIQTNPSSILGTNDIAPLTVAAAYAGIANHGIFCEPIAVTSVLGPDGSELPGQDAKCRQAISEGVAAAAVSALETAMNGYQAKTSDGTPLMGKTGTTNDSKQTWVTSSSSKVTTTIWVGNISGTYPIRTYPGGSNIRHIIANEIMTAVNKRYKGGDFDDAPNRLITGTQITVGDYIGTTPEVAKSAIEGAKLEYDKAGTVDSDLPAGQIARQSPSAGSKAALGSTVKIWLSNGEQTRMPDVIGQNFDAAVATINGAGFATVTEVCTPLPEDGDPALLNTVQSSDPPANKAVSRERNIKLAVIREAC